ncbi:mCG1044858, isoform CRA_a [Mus musculus]|jgi:hypothetical protein|uniref:Uncharacterized protein n=1 Tax=Mus musculus TaxID=10090 RepID=Q3UQW1_MOUSE|nr:mCG1044858, isoform CRA_a [Mus musculus]BAE24927.1 unnamed protein product [Mus musculus]
MYGHNDLSKKQLEPWEPSAHFMIILLQGNLAVWMHPTVLLLTREGWDRSEARSTETLKREPPSQQPKSRSLNGGNQGRDSCRVPNPWALHFASILHASVFLCTTFPLKPHFLFQRPQWGSVQRIKICLLCYKREYRPCWSGTLAQWPFVLLLND